MSVLFRVFGVLVKCYILMMSVGNTGFFLTYMLFKYLIVRDRIYKETHLCVGLP